MTMLALFAAAVLVVMMLAIVGISTGLLHSYRG
jgi:hypothetical protein